jgi:hypothetical protein
MWNTCVVWAQPTVALLSCTAKVVIIVSNHYVGHQYRGHNWLPWEGRQSRVQASVWKLSRVCEPLAWLYVLLSIWRDCTVMTLQGLARHLVPILWVILLNYSVMISGREKNWDKLVLDSHNPVNAGSFVSVEDFVHLTRRTDRRRAPRRLNVWQYWPPSVGPADF